MRRQTGSSSQRKVEKSKRYSPSIPSSQSETDSGLRSFQTIKSDLESSDFENKRRLKRRQAGKMFFHSLIHFQDSCPGSESNCEQSFSQGSELSYLRVRKQVYEVRSHRFENIRKTSKRMTVKWSRKSVTRSALFELSGFCAASSWRVSGTVYVKAQQFDFLISS